MAVPSWARPGAWLRPFDELAVGDRYRSKGRTVTEADIVRYSAVTGEMNATRGDPGRVGTGIAPDLLALTYSIGLVPNYRVSALRRILDLSVLAPVRVGDTIHVECEIVRLDEWTADYGLVAGAWEIVRQDGTVAMTVELEAVWRCDRL